MNHGILFSHFCLFQNSLIELLNPKGSHFITKLIKLCWNKILKETHFSQNELIIGSNIFSQVLHHKHVSWSFDSYYLTFGDKSIWRLDKSLVSNWFDLICKSQIWFVLSYFFIVNFVHLDLKLLGTQMKEKILSQLDIATD